MRTARTTTKSPRSAASSRTPRATTSARKTAVSKAPAAKSARTAEGRGASVRKSPATSGSASELVPLLVYIPRRVRERLNKLVRDIELANQAEAISKLVNDAYRR